MSPALAVVTALVFLIAFPPSYWLLSRIALRTRSPVIWLRRMLGSLWIVAGLAYLAFLLVGLGDVARTAATNLLPVGADSVVGAFASQFTICLTAAGVTVTSYAPLVSAIRNVREIYLSTHTAVRRLGRYAVAFAALLSALLVFLLEALSDAGSVLNWLFLLGVIVALPFVTPYLVRVFRDTRAPDDCERERLERLCEKSDLTASETVIFEDADETLEIHVRGIPGWQQLFVSTFLLERFDDETIEALLAVHTGRLQNHYRGFASHSVVGVLVLVAGALLWGSGTLVVGAVVVGLVVLVLSRLAARRAVFRGDEYAGERVGRETVVRAFEQVADEQNVAVSRGGIGRRLQSRPSLGRRIDRLREQK